MIQQPSTTLTEEAANKIANAFPESHTDTARVLWWDDGGYLEDIVKSAADDIGVDFRAAEKFPLDLRIGAVDEEREANKPVIWYINEAKDGRDWFRDIRETGGEITCSIEELTAELYDVNPWEVFDVERHDPDARRKAAFIIKRRFAPHSIPQYDDLKEEIITKGGGQILDHLLRDGWPEISQDPGTVHEVRNRLQNKYSIPVPENAGPQDITTIVRRWAVAALLVNSGIDSDKFDTGYGEVAQSPLSDLLRIRGTQATAEQYLGSQFWPEVIDALGEVWDYADCPVDGALDTALWATWKNSFESDELTTCIEQAQRRQEALSVYPDETAWVKLWNQSEHLARLRQYFVEWDEREQGADPFDLYADVDEGSWRIDNEVLHLQLTGTPEEELQSTHPAVDELPEFRNQLLTAQYRDYLDTLAESVEAAMQVGAPLVNKQPAYEWWSDHEDDFDELGTVAIFLIDALRFDLAQRLAERLSTDFEVKHETRMATLPTETKFGMAALTPGRSFRFDIRMDGEELTVFQGERSLSNKTRRIDFYEDEGWQVPDEPDTGWEHQNIAYYDKEIDEVGEGEVGDIERHFDDYVTDLAETIQQKLTQKGWDRIYVVTDHGFVLLPEGTTMESVSSDVPDSELKYRRVAAADFDHSDISAGVHIPAETAGLNYLNADLQLLVDPRLYFSKQGYSGDRYYHGGLLPQECMLSFLEIQQ